MYQFITSGPDSSRRNLSTKSFKSLNLIFTLKLLSRARRGTESLFFVSINLMLFPGVRYLTLCRSQVSGILKPEK